MNSKVIILVILVIVLAAGVFFYLQSQNSANDQPTERSVMEEIQETVMKSSPSGVAESPSTGSAMTESSDAGVKEIIVEGSNFKFAPNNITVNKGDKVKVVFKNVGGMPHDFTIDELDVKTKTITVGNTDTVEFTADTAGTFEFYCSVG